MARFIILCLALLIFLGEKYSNALHINREDQDIDIDVNLLDNSEDLTNPKSLLHSDKRLWYEVGSGDCVPEGYCCKYSNFRAACCQGLRCVCNRHEFFCWCTAP